MSNNNITDISGLVKKGNAWKKVAEGGTEEEGKVTQMCDEDVIQLARSWVAISENPVTGRDITNPKFWSQITLHYNDHSSRVGRPPRAMGTLKNRWTKLRGACVKFSGFCATAKRTQPSGTLDIELEDAAHALLLAGK